jgi:hypothetical protein
MMKKTSTTMEREAMSGSSLSTTMRTIKRMNDNDWRND